ncbi:MAG: class I SAM-dependent methyltransferase [Sphingomonas sp.]
MEGARSAGAWKTRYTPIADWDRMFAEGEWDYLDSLGEAARYALIAGYIHRRPPPISVLDVGCGAGILLRYLDHSRVRYSGIDLSSAAIEQARARFPGAEFNALDVSDYAPPGEAFGVVVFNEVLPHIDDPLGELARYLEYLRPNGIVVISTYQNPNPRSNAAMFSQLLDAAIADGEFKSLAGCQVVTSEKGLKWRIDVIAAERSVDDEY